MQEIKVAKIRENSKLPDRAHSADAGMDVFFCPEIRGGSTETFTLKGNFLIKEWSVSRLEKEKLFKKKVILQPGENAILPTGVKLEIPPGYVAMMCNRSSVAAKSSLLFGAHIIDPGYKGEVFVDLHNTGLTEVEITPGDKIAQILLIPICTPYIRSVPEEDLYNLVIITDERGEGTLGSTGK